MSDKTTLKTKFETGDKPSQVDFYDLIDSCFNDEGITSLPDQTDKTLFSLVSNGTSAYWEYQTNREVSYTIDASTTGIGITFETVYDTEVEFETDSGNYIPETWVKITNYYGSGVQSVYISTDGTPDSYYHNDMSFSPYIAYSNGESRLLCKCPDQNCNTYIILPTSTDYPEICQTIETDFRYFLDSSTSRAYVFCKELRNTNFVNQFTNSDLGNYFKIYKNQHIEFEFYGEGGEIGSYVDMYWVPTGKLGLLFQEDNYSGWGNNASINSSGDLTRYTLSQTEYEGTTSIDITNETKMLVSQNQVANIPDADYNYKSLNTIVTNLMPGYMLSENGGGSQYMSMYEIYDDSDIYVYIPDKTQFDIKELYVAHYQTGTPYIELSHIEFDTSFFGLKLTPAASANFDASYDIIEFEEQHNINPTGQEYVKILIKQIDGSFYTTNAFYYNGNSVRVSNTLTQAIMESQKIVGWSILVTGRTDQLVYNTLYSLCYKLKIKDDQAVDKALDA